MPQTEVSPEQFREVIGQFASGVTIVTTSRAGEPFGTTASAVSSLSLVPPMLLICLNKTSATGQAIADSAQFVVNILGEDVPELAVKFAGKGPDKFDGVDVQRGDEGIPILSEAIATLTCRVSETVSGGTHLVFLAGVDRVEQRGGSPLAYFRGEFGRLELADDQAALREIRRRVLHRDIAVGEPLNLELLAERLNIARGSVYHALSKLSREGLVERNAEGAFIVPPITLDSVLESARAGLAIFLGATLLAVGEDKKIAELRQLLDDIKPPLDSSVSVEEWLRSRPDFIARLMCSVGGNVLADAFHRADSPSQMLRLWRNGAAFHREDVEYIHLAYADLIAAIDSGDLPKLRRLLEFYEDWYRRAFAQDRRPHR